MNKLYLFRIVLMLCIVVFCTSCSTESASLDMDRANISVKLFDAPGDYEKVYVEIEDVLLLTIDDKTAPNCWLSLNAKRGVYDLLDLTGGVEALLVDKLSIPEGMIYEVRLVLGDNNSLVTNGQTLPLFTPNTLQNGLVIRVDQMLRSNLDYTFLIDFDVEKSVIKTSTPDYFVLKPELRSSMEVLSGSIHGKISNTQVQTQISIISETQQISTFTDSEGNFMLKGVPSGKYNLQITPDSNSGYVEMGVNNIDVTVGKITEIGNIELE